MRFLLNGRSPEARKRQKGFTLAEFGLYTVLAIIGIAGVFAAYSVVSSSSNERDAFTELGIIQNGVHAIYSGQGSYTGLSAADLVSGKVLAGKYVDSSGTGLVHPFGGTVTIAAASFDSGTDNGFLVTYATLPVDACVRMATKDMGTNLVQVKVGTTTYSTFPVTVANAKTACGTASAPIAWTFR